MKRVIFRILAVMLIFVLCLSMSAAVYADNISAELVTIKSGDTLEGLCRARGLNYYSCKSTIMKLNGYTDESQLNTIRVGDMLYLPASGNSSSASSSASSTAYKAAIVSTGISASAAAELGDSVSSFIIVYTLKYGDSLDGIYRGWGLNYSAYANQIAQLNNSVDLNRLTAGQTLFLPVTNSIADYQISYIIFVHTVRSGETMTSFCSDRGVSLSQFGNTLQLFNNGLDFSRIAVGQKIFYPTVGTASETASTAAVTYPISSTVSTAASTAVSQTQSVAVPQSTAPVNPVLPNTSELYVGYGVVKSYGNYMCIALENEEVDVYLTYNSLILKDYIPRAGDYVKVAFTPTDFLLASISYVYNVFDS